jgi:DNA-binding SARP family transcriptional activator
MHLKLLEAGVDYKAANLEVYTFGKFLVKKGDKHLSESSNRSYKLWELFKFLLTNKERGCQGEVLQEAIWNNDCPDNNRALRTLVYRLRKTLDEDLPQDESFISFSHGCYSFKILNNCKIDCIDFERLYNKATILENDYPTKAKDLYLEAIALYKGEYLSECVNSDWVLQTRNYYRRIYLQCVNKLLKLLDSMKNYNKIISLCEKVFLVEPLEEDIHKYYIKALMENGNFKQAKEHYEYITSLLYSELGVKPSSELREIYRLIKIDSNSIDLDINSIKENIKERNKNYGTYVCDPEIFRHIYKLEARRKERAGIESTLGLLTLIQNNYKLPAKKELSEAMETLKNIVMMTLRKGDVICVWNEAQIIFLINGASLEGSQLVINRIVSVFNKLGIESLTLTKNLISVENEILL